MATSIGGLDAVVFTGGIGENSADVRLSTCKKLGFLGIQLDEGKNSSAKPCVEVSSAESRACVLVIQAQEDWAIAQKCVQVSH